MDDNANDNKRQKLHSNGSCPGKDLAREQWRLENDKREFDARSQKFDAEKEATTKDEREKLEDEKEAMVKSDVTENDVLELDVGGEMFRVQRGTLLLAPEDSHLHAMFSGRWEESLSRSQEGAIFVDMSPHVFRVILSRLRGSKLRAKLPAWADLKAEDPIFEYELRAALQFFGLIDPIPPTLMTASAYGGIDVLHGLVLTRNSDGEDYRAAISSEEIPDGSVWKICIKSLHCNDNDRIFAGIIGASTTPSTYSHRDRTSYGWSGRKIVWANGVPRDVEDGWYKWEADDVAIFKLENTSLKMYHVRLKRTFTIQLYSDSRWKVHLNMNNAGDKVELSMPTDQEIGMLD